MKTLFVTAGPPLPADRGARVRDHALISRVAAERPVSLLSFVGSPGEAEGLEPMREGLESVNAVVVPDRARPPARLRPRGPRVPVACVPYLDSGAAKAFREVVERESPDLVQLEHWLLAPLIDALPPGSASGIAFVSSLHNVGSAQYRAMSRAEGAARAPLAALKSRLVGRVERRYLPRFDAVLVVSEDDRALADEIAPGVPLELVPNGVDTARLRPLPAPGDPGVLLMVANYDYRPNLDGAGWLCREVLPLIAEAHPDARVKLVGPGGGGGIAALGRLPGVEVVGPVDDLTPHYASAQVAVAPLHSGGGTRLKVLEAMALGRPVVSTAIGCEGMGFTAGEQLLVADDAPAFAAVVAGLLGSPQRRAALAAAGRLAVVRGHDWSASGSALTAAHVRALARAHEPRQDPPS